MYCVGLTGNIASGKSTVAGYFVKLGVDVINADAIARELTKNGQPSFDAIVTHFGEAVVTESGELNRAYLRNLIFNDNDERQWLESLLHPLIRDRIIDMIHHCQGAYCVIEIPLLPSKKNHPYLNRILFIQAHVEQQIERLMARDSSTKEMALTILATQADILEHYQIADDILVNQLHVEHLKEQVEALHGKYLQYAMSAYSSL